MIDIRPLDQKDVLLLPSIEDEAGKAFLDHGLSQIVEAGPSPVQEYETLYAEGHIIGAYSADKLVGFCAMKEVDGQGYVCELDVRPALRRQGIGRSLMQSAIQWARAKNYRAMTLTTFADLPFNGPFYASMGFRSFTPDASWPQLANIRAIEAQRGFDFIPRIAMKLDL